MWHRLILFTTHPHTHALAHTHTVSLNQKSLSQSHSKFGTHWNLLWYAWNLISSNFIHFFSSLCVLFYPLVGQTYKWIGHWEWEKDGLTYRTTMIFHSIWKCVYVSVLGVHVLRQTNLKMASISRWFWEFILNQTWNDAMRWAPNRFNWILSYLYNMSLSRSLSIYLCMWKFVMSTVWHVPYYSLPPSRRIKKNIHDHLNPFTKQKLIFWRIIWTAVSYNGFRFLPRF